MGEELLKNLGFSYQVLSSTEVSASLAGVWGQPHIVQPPFTKELGLSRNSGHLPPGSVKASHRAWLKW